MQRNWIRKSTGAQPFKIKDTDKDFTVRLPTPFLVRLHAVLPPCTCRRHRAEQAQAGRLQHAASLKSDLARTDLAKEKPGA